MVRGPGARSLRRGRVVMGLAVVAIGLIGAGFLAPPSGVPTPAAPARAGGASSLAAPAAPVLSTPSPRTTSYNVTFTASGLPPSTNWDVHVILPGGAYDGYGGNVPSFTAQLTNGSYSYTVPPLAQYLANPDSGNFNVSGSDLQITIYFYLAPTYAVTFNETGLPASAPWTLAVVWNDVGPYSRESYTVTGSPVVLALRNDSYTYTVDGPPSYGATPSAGDFYVQGGPLTIPVAFHSGRYSLQFVESGLPSGTNWSVTVNGTTNFSVGMTIQDYFDNGSYYYVVTAPPGFAPSPAAGTLIVQGTSVVAQIDFVAVRFAVTFTETGLPPGTYWQVNLNGTARASSNATVTFQEPNGTYAFKVAGVAGYRAAAYTGTIGVSGLANGTIVSWARTLYSIRFTEAGLPAGDAWTLEFNGSSEPAGPTALTFVEPNGTYAFAVASPGGYWASPASGNVTVNGLNLTQPVNFTVNPSGGSTPSFAPGSPLFLIAVGSAAAAVAIAAALLVARERRRKAA